jgi:hypothetical protein
MNIHTDAFDRLITRAMAQITEAASTHDLAAIQRLSRVAAELKELKEQQAAIHQRRASIEQELDKQSTAVYQAQTSLHTAELSTAPVVVKQQSNRELRKLPVEVTAGDLRQNLLKLTPQMRQGTIRANEEMVIEALPSGERFQTVVLEKGNKLRARGEIARFYKDAQVKPGEYVLLTEQTPGRWTLKKAPPGEYGPRYLTE